MTELWQQGFEILRGFFVEQEIRNIRSEMTSVFTNFSTACDLDAACMEVFEKDFDVYLACAKTCSNLLSVSNLFTSRKITAHLWNEGLKIPVIRTEPIIHFSSPRTAKSDLYWKVPWHQDWPSNLASLNGLTCWVPLQDTDLDLGALHVVPKSHLLGAIPHRYEEIPILDDSYSDFEVVDMKLGDMLVFSNFLIHRSGINFIANHIRFSIACRFADANEPSFIQRRYPARPVGSDRVSTEFPTAEQIKAYFNVD